jgi:5-methylcytosine-specific restriction endonuclease McrA
VSDARSAEAAAWRWWYNTARWRALRRAQLEAHPLCAFCEADGRLTAATTADHVVPHKGCVVLFFDPRNLQSLCTPHHSRTKQQIERRGFHTRVGANGWPLDPAHPANRGAG